MMRKTSCTIQFLFFLAFLHTSCGADKKTSEDSPAKTVNEQYECPMKCTEEVFKNAGKCPVCEMDLAPVSNG